MAKDLNEILFQFDILNQRFSFCDLLQESQELVLNKYFPGKEIKWRTLSIQEIQNFTGEYFYVVPIGEFSNCKEQWCEFDSDKEVAIEEALNPYESVLHNVGIDSYGKCWTAKLAYCE